MLGVSVLLSALALDLALGDPPNRWHPVAWIGTALGRGTRRLGRGSPASLIAGGTTLTLAVVALAAAVAVLLVMVTRRLGGFGLVVEALALSMLLSVKGLVRSARAVDADLAAGDLVAARATVARHLVSRPTEALDAAHVVSATIESVAENVTDSVLAPACFYLAFGLPGAAAYRAVNTADAMIGYREGALEYFGKFAARLDDVLNFVPARLAGVAIVVGAILAKANALRAWQVMRRDARRTASPNAGWPMAAMAGALGVSLEKSNAYYLGDGALPARADIDRALLIVKRAVLAGVTIIAIARIAIAGAR